MRCGSTSTAKTVAPAKIPASGGGYFRLYPYKLSKFLINRINKAGRPAMFYLHPWELDPRQPRLAEASMKSRWRHHVNIRSTEKKLEQLLRDFDFGTMSDAIRAQQGIAQDNESTPLPRQLTSDY